MGQVIRLSISPAARAWIDQLILQMMVTTRTEYGGEYVQASILMHVDGE